MINILTSLVASVANFFTSRNDIKFKMEESHNQHLKGNLKGNLKDLPSKFIDIKTIASVLLTLVAAFSWVASILEAFLDFYVDIIRVTMR